MRGLGEGFCDGTLFLLFFSWEEGGRGEGW
jgi:hypothetical protein